MFNNVLSVDGVLNANTLNAFGSGYDNQPLSAPHQATRKRFRAGAQDAGSACGIGMPASL